MILFGIRIERYRPQQPGHLHCVTCGSQLRRGDRFTIISVRHCDCYDRRGVGQIPLFTQEKGPTN